MNVQVKEISEQKHVTSLLRCGKLPVYNVGLRGQLRVTISGSLENIC